MKRAGRKIVVFILALVMCLGILPAGVQRASATTIISSVKFNGLIGPMTDGSAQTTLADIHYQSTGFKVKSMVWQKEDYQLGVFKDISSTQKFEKGNRYRFIVAIEPDSGYEFKVNSQNQPDLEVLASGADPDQVVAIADLDPRKVLAVISQPYVCEFSYIRDVQVSGFVAPVAGEKAITKEDLIVPSDAQYTVKKIEWLNHTDGHKLCPEGFTFEPGYKYYADILLQSKDSNKYRFIGGRAGYGEELKTLAIYDLDKKNVLDPEYDFVDDRDDGKLGNISTMDFEPKLKITFDANGGSGSMKDVLTEYGSSYALPACTFTAPQGKIFDKWDAGAAGASITLKDNLILKAIWKDAGPKDSPYPAAKVSPENPIPLENIEAAIPTRKNDKDLNCSTFSLLQAKGSPKGSNAIKLKWQPVEGADGYIIYGNKCGKKYHYEKLKTTAKTSFKQKKLKKGTYYKYIVVAFKGDQALAASKTIHVATTGGKVGNNTGVRLNKTKATIKRKKTTKVKATLLQSNLRVKKHRAVAFESSDYRIATVTQKGKIKGVKKGTCYIYAYAQNGMCTKIKVKVKK